jgi:hypothetical protein
MILHGTGFYDPKTDLESVKREGQEEGGERL